MLGEEIKSTEFYQTCSISFFMKTRALSQNVTNAPEGALTPNLKNVKVTVQNKLHYCRKFSGQNSSMKINKEQ